MYISEDETASKTFVYVLTLKSNHEYILRIQLYVRARHIHECLVKITKLNAAISNSLLICQNSTT